MDKLFGDLFKRKDREPDLNSFTTLFVRRCISDPSKFGKADQRYLNVDQLDGLGFKQESLQQLTLSGVLAQVQKADDKGHENLYGLRDEVFKMTREKVVQAHLEEINVDETFQKLKGRYKSVQSELHKASGYVPITALFNDELTPLDWEAISAKVYTRVYIDKDSTTTPIIKVP